MQNKFFVDLLVIQHRRKFISFRAMNRNKKLNQNLSPNLKLISKSIVSQSLNKTKRHTGPNIGVSLKRA